MKVQIEQSTTGFYVPSDSQPEQMDDNELSPNFGKWLRENNKNYYNFAGTGYTNFIVELGDVHEFFKEVEKQNIDPSTTNISTINFIQPFLIRYFERCNMTFLDQDGKEIHYNDGIDLL